MKQLSYLNDLIYFLDSKIFKLNVGLASSENLEKNVHENEVSMWRNKRQELVALQEKIMNEQIKELAQ